MINLANLEVYLIKKNNSILINNDKNKKKKNGLIKIGGEIVSLIYYFYPHDTTSLSLL